MADDKIGSFTDDGKDINELSAEEQAVLAYERSNVSKEDFNPNVDDWDHANSVVELPNRASVVVSDLVDHPDPVIASDAQSVVDGNFPGGPNYPNGPEAQSQRTAAPAKSAPAPKSNESASSSNQ